MSPVADWANQHMDVVDMVAELTRPWVSSEGYQLDSITGGPGIGLLHQTRVPSLLVQLEHAAPSGQGDDRGSAGYESRPAARVEALDVLITIEHETERWLTRTEPTASSYPDHLADQVARLGSKVRTLTWCKRGKSTNRGACCDRHKLEGDVRRWWAQSRIVAGWDSPAWKPDATCPACGVRGGLRIRLSAHVGFCVDCRETWDHETVELLGRHVREEAFARSRARRLDPCWCPWPLDLDVEWPPMCARCASVRCWRAFEAGELAAIEKLAA